MRELESIETIWTQMAYVGDEKKRDTYIEARWASLALKKDVESIHYSTSLGLFSS